MCSFGGFVGFIVFVGLSVCEFVDCSACVCVCVSMSLWACVFVCGFVGFFVKLLVFVCIGVYLCVSSYNSCCIKPFKINNDDNAL